MKGGRINGLTVEPIKRTSTQSISVSSNVITLTSEIPGLKIGDIIEFEVGSVFDCRIGYYDTGGALYLISNTVDIGNKFLRIDYEETPYPNNQSLTLTSGAASALSGVGYSGTSNPSGYTHFCTISNVDLLDYYLITLSSPPTLDLSGFKQIKLKQVYRGFVNSISLNKLVINVYRVDNSPVIPDDTYSSLNFYKQSGYRGNSSFKSVGEITLSQVSADSVSGNTLVPHDTSFIEVLDSGITSLTKIRGGSAGKVLYILNSTGNLLEIVHNTGDQPLDRFDLPNGESVWVPNKSVLKVLYSSNLTRWVVDSSTISERDTGISITGLTNVTNSNNLNGKLRISNGFVNVKGAIEITPTASVTLTKVGIDLPYGSVDLTTDYQLFGYGSVKSVGIKPVHVFADTTNDRAELWFESSSTSAEIIHFEFTYKLE